jgi:GNAT superfamily N-acetyltransferase
MTEDSAKIPRIEPIIRAAVKEDRPAIVLMDLEGRSRVAGQRGGDAWIAEHPPIEDLLRNPDVRVLVAELTGVVIGFSSSFDVQDLLRGRICCIERVYVDVGAREIGCGDALLAEEISAALIRHCEIIEAHALPGDRETKNLYERAGITARSITVSKRLSDPSTEERASR